ncbi:biotin/lipoyl-containing protein [Nocardioides alcanivorans]|uniref:biotin/lipoyl-containing protein n=1 Tax=Nocardioides alcanivorans TaxID=2897352 RepID=UPI001F464FEF|nr:biotin/lipoyl-containing protein [Nocardioides alcanivorans]
MRMEVEVPDLGDGVTDCFVVEWLKKTGDWIDEGDALVEVMTDKSNVEIPAPAAGTVTEILVDADSRVKVGQPIAVLERA